VNAFTAGYLVRLELWGLLAVLAQGGLLSASWRAWRRAAGGTGAPSLHRIACLHLAALALLPALTLVVLQGAVGALAGAPPPGSTVASLAAGSDDARLALGAALALAWLAGVAAMLWRLAREARASGRLGRSPVSAPVRAALDRLAARGLARPMPGAREAAVATPQVVGWLRPTLLVPRDLCERLDAAGLDAVLLHELAHVRRADLRWNLAQRLVLALLWFHPVAWRLQAAIARERERCCDALAVRHGAAPAALARALVTLAQALPGPRPVLALRAARGDGLVERVRALVEPAHPERPRPARVAAALALSAACVAALAGGRLAGADAALRDFYVASAFGPTIDIQARDAAGPFALRVRQGRVLAAFVRDQPVRVEQRGRRVTLSDGTRAPPLELTVTPQDRVLWQARRQAPGACGTAGCSYKVR
jgi:beta-lactamase regulating signal transducer with metallopeptidase domain